MPPLPPSALITALARFRRETDKRDAATIKQLSNAYSKLFRRLSEALELEARRIFEQDGVSRVYVGNRLADLIEQVEVELRKYSSFLETTITTSADDALTLGSRQAVELMKLATLGQRAIIGVDFNRLPVATINTMLGFLSPSSPLFQRIGVLAKYHAPIIRDQLVEAIALGFNPYKTAGNIRPYLADIADKFKIAMARPFADAVRMARTSQLWASREAARANYQANSDVVSGWTWYANLDGITCPACLSLHGSIHELDEELDGHYNCRCTPVPVVLGQSLIPESAGRDYFDSLTDEQRQSLLGPGAFQAYQAGSFEFSQLSHQVEDDTYGHMRTVTPLKDLIGE